MLSDIRQQANNRKVKLRIKSKVLLLDSTTISLCLKLYDWVQYRTAKGAVKMHTLFDYERNLPTYANITSGKVAENKGAKDIPLTKGSVIVADRFYYDFPLLSIWDCNKVSFVIQHKDNLQFKSVEENKLPEKQEP